MSDDKSPGPGLNIFNRLRSRSIGSGIPSAPSSDPIPISPPHPNPHPISNPKSTHALSASYNPSIINISDESDTSIELSSSVPSGSPMNRLFDGFFARRFSSGNDNARASPVTFSPATLHANDFETSGLSGIDTSITSPLPSHSPIPIPPASTTASGASADRPSLLANGGARLSDLRRKQNRKDRDMFVVLSAAGMQ